MSASRSISSSSYRRSIPGTRLLREAGHTEQADRVERDLVGRDVIPGMRTFEIVEADNTTYHRSFAGVEEQVHQDLAEGRRHLAEAEMQRAARSRRRRHTAP